MKINFLEAYCPLTKTISPTSIDAYPMAGTFTSYTEEITTTKQLFEAIRIHAAKGRCLLKGLLKSPLEHESRRHATSTDDPTEYVCFDFDLHETANIDDELRIMGLGDISYVLQYSASHGLDENMGTISAHIFMRLTRSVPAPTLKAWLMDINLTHFQAGLRLSKTKSCISWPLDITTCQNDKLLFIAPPTFIGMSDPLQTRISFVKKPLDAIPVERVSERHIVALKRDAGIALNTLRKAEGLPARTARTVWVGTVEVVSKPDTCTVTGVKVSDEFVRLNLNGGDSWAFWHPIDNFELIHDFKSDSWYKTKELVPSYYSEKLQEQQALNSTPTTSGNLLLAFRDLKTALYYNGMWNPDAQILEIYKAKNETQLEHWMLSHGRTLGAFIPIWDIMYNPREEWIVDEDGHRINTFVMSEYMRLTPDRDARFPIILQLIRHMLGATTPTDELIVNHFLNWFACIFQRKHKPTTAWVTHGCEGTGKGYFFKRIVKPLLAARNAEYTMVGNLEDTFNSWMEGKLFIFVDEIDVDDFSEKGRVTSKLKSYITEPTIPMRGMREASKNVPNYTSFMFGSNQQQPVHIPMNDRRYNVANYQPLKLPRPDDDAISAELENFAKFLLAHKASITEADSVLTTEARTRIQRLGITSTVETCQYILQGDFEALWLARPDEKLMASATVITQHTQNAQAYCMLLRQIASETIGNPDLQNEYPLSRDEIQVMLQYNVGSMPLTPNKFTALLRHNGINTVRIRKHDQRTYGIKVCWTFSDELREELVNTLTSSKTSSKIRAVK